MVPSCVRFTSYYMKNTIKQVGFVMYLIAIITVVSVALASCSSVNYGSCSAYACVDVEVTD